MIRKLTNLLAAVSLAFATPFAALAQTVVNPPTPSAASQPYIAATAYGAKCNGQTVYNLTTTSGSPTITGSGFTAADAGKDISIYAGTSVSLSGVTVAAGSEVVTVASTSGLTNGMNLQSSTSLPNNDYVTGVLSSTQFTMDKPAAAAISNGAMLAIPVLNTTIQSASAGSATLAVNASLTRSGTVQASYGSDDTAALQAAEAAANANGGGMIQLPVGTCITSATLNWDGNISLHGFGPGKSIIKYIAGSDQTSPVILTTHTGTCSYANALPYHDNQFTDFEIDEQSSTLATYNVSAKGLSFPCSVRSYVHNVYAHDCPATCIATDQGMPTVLTDNVIRNPGRLGAGNPGSSGIGEGLSGLVEEDYTIAHNVVYNPDHYGIFVETQYAQTEPAAVVIDGNTVYQGGNSQSATFAFGNSSAGIGQSGATGAAITGNFIYGLSSSTAAWLGIVEDPGTLVYKSGVQSVVSGNYVRSVSGGGIVVNYYGTGGSSNARTLISNNEVYAAGGNCFGVTSYNTTGSTVGAEVSFIGDVGLGCGSAGLLLAGASPISDIVIDGVQLIDNGATTTNASYRRAAISVATTTTNLKISNSLLTDDGAATQLYGFGSNTGITITNLDMEVNTFNGNVTSPLLQQATLATPIIRNNQGYNPLGTVTDTVGSSPWTYTAGATPEVLYLTGGTVSSVTKGGNTVAVSSGVGIPLSPGESAVVTYSAAPTAVSDRQ